MTLDEIGSLINKTRKNRKLSQAKLGAPLGMSRATISGIENGSIPEIGIRKVMSVCTALGIELVAKEKASRPTLRQLLKERNRA